MKALWFDGKRLSLREMKIPEPRKDEALIRIHYAGICNTDLEIFKGYMNFTGIPGHEFVGTVVKGKTNWLGKRVVGEINLSCGKCAYCGKGLNRHCPDRTVLGIFKKNGAFAEYLTLPLDNLHPVPDSLSDLEAVFVEPLAAALRILEQVPLKKDQRVFLLGDGKLAQLIARAVWLKNKNLLVIGKHPEKLALLSRVGIKTILASHLKPLSPDRKADIVIEATGNPAGLETAFNLCRATGRIVLKSTFHQKPKVDLSRLVVDELNLLGSRCGDFTKALKHLAREKIDPRELISGIYELEDFAKAFKQANSNKALKVILKCQT